MEIVTHKAKKPKAGERPEHSYMMVRMTREEALATIASLALQIQNDDPNTGRLESRVKSGEFVGFFSISVSEEDRHCIECDVGIDPFKGKRVKQGLVCEKCDTPAERRAKNRKRRMFGHTGIPKSTRSPPIGGIR